MEICSATLASFLLFMNGFGGVGAGIFFVLFGAVFYLAILAILIVVFIKFLQIAKDVKAIRNKLDNDEKES